jgi:hypothetical protein
MKNKIVIVVIVLGTLFLGLVLMNYFSGNNSGSPNKSGGTQSGKTGQNNQQKAVPTPDKVIIPTRADVKFKSDTGATYISPTENEYTQIELVRSLRSKCPVNSSVFTINFDYKINKFVVVIVDGLATNRMQFDKWMADSGYDQIDGKYLEIRQ